MEVIREEQIQHYRDHGYVILENFLSPELLAGARQEVESFIPGWLDYAANPTGPKPPNWDEVSRSRRTRRFPFSGPHLNAITLHPELRRFASLMAGGGDIICEQSDLTYKCKGHYADADQEMHLDYVNHTLTYPPKDPAYWQTAFLIYYTDVAEHEAPTAVCSWQHYADEILWPAFHKRQDRPSLYDHEVKTTMPAGSVLAYSMRTFHRGTAFLDEGARVAHFVSYAPAKPRWMGIIGWPEQGIYPSFYNWLENATPQERELIGFPSPSDAYWTEETVAGVSARYPNMDMTPYKK
jgi:hypothetical protein|tara:strand:- start:13774 stop:14658 length:885 start_codon:yes stop_codon:yes gene_type:complete